MLELRNCRVELIPWLRVGDVDVELRPKDARVVQARRSDANAAVALAAGNAAAALGAKSTLILSSRHTFGEVIAEFAFRQRERTFREVHHRQISAARNVLAIAAVAVAHYHRLGIAYVSYGSADAAALKTAHGPLLGAAKLVS